MGGLSEAQANRIAREAYELQNELPMIPYLLTTLNNQSIPYHDKELIVMALHRQQDKGGLFKQLTAIRSLNMLMQSRRTSMSELVCWQKLGLPVLP
jgi:hypothetical protein